MNNKKYIILSTTIILIAITLRLIFTGGISYDDSFPYCQQAHHIAAGNYILNSDLYYSMNTAFIFMLGLFVTIFGDNAIGYYGWPFLAGILSIMLAMKTAREYFDEKAALFTGLILTFVPLLVVWSTIPLPDSISPLLWSLFFYFFFKAEKSENNTKEKIYFALSGLILGISFYNRIFSVVILLVIPFMMIFNKKFSFKYSWVAVGFLIAFLLGNGTYYIASGDFFLRYHNTLAKKSWAFSPNGYVELPATWSFFQSSFLPYTKSFFSRVGLKDWGIIFYGALAGLILIINNKQIKNKSIIIIWILSIIISMDVILNSVTSLNEWKPYVMAVTIPASILFGLFLNNLYFHKNLLENKKRITIIFISFFIILIGILSIIRVKKILFNNYFIGGMFLFILVFGIYNIFIKRIKLQYIIKTLVIFIVFFYSITSLIYANQYSSTLKNKILQRRTLIEKIINSNTNTVYYLTYKYSVRLIPQFWFKTNYSFSNDWRNFESWDASINDKTIHFEFLPQKESKFKKNDCILLHKPFLERFRKYGIGEGPVFKSVGYDYPKYILIPPSNWKMFYEDSKDILYQVL